MISRLRKYTALLLILTIVFSQNIIYAAAKTGNVSNKYTFHVSAADDSSSLNSDEVSANFRNVKAGKIGAFNLFRSQHPANGSTRSFYANKLAEKNAINTVLNLSDSDKKLNSYFRKYKNKKYKIKYPYYYKALYDKGNVYTADISSLYRASSYQKKTVQCMRFISRRKGPYLVHCEVGRDRTAFVILVIECLMGASYTYMLNDDAKTFMNREGKSYVEARKISVPRLNEIFQYITGKPKNTNWGKVNLRQCAELYLKKGGMTPAEINALKRNLSINYPEGGPVYRLKNVPRKWPESGTIPDGSCAFDTASGQAAKDNTSEGEEENQD